MNHYTTLEESKKLAEIFGLVKTEYTHFIFNDDELFGRLHDIGEPDCLVSIGNTHLPITPDKVYPAHTIGSLLELMPDMVEVKGWKYLLTMVKLENTYLWMYEHTDGSSMDELEGFRHINPLTALTNLCEWLNSNGYLPKKGEGK